MVKMTEYVFSLSFKNSYELIKRKINIHI